MILLAVLLLFILWLVAVWRLGFRRELVSAGEALILLLVLIGPLVAATALWLRELGRTSDFAFYMTLFRGLVFIGALAQVSLVALAYVAYRYGRAGGVSLLIPALVWAVAAMLPPTVVGALAFPWAMPVLPLLFVLGLVFATVPLVLVLYRHRRILHASLVVPAVAPAILAGLIVAAPLAYLVYGEEQTAEIGKRSREFERATRAAAEQMLAEWERDGCSVWRDYIVRGVSVDGAQRVWVWLYRYGVANDTFLAEWDHGTLAMSPFSLDLLSSVASDGKGRLWLITKRDGDYGVTVLRDRPPFDEMLFPQSALFPLSSSSYGWKLASDGRGTVAIASSGSPGVAILRNEEWALASPSHREVVGLTFDPSGRLWVLLQSPTGELPLAWLDESGWVSEDYQWIKYVDTFRVRSTGQFFGLHPFSYLHPISDGWRDLGGSERGQVVESGGRLWLHKPPRYQSDRTLMLVQGERTVTYRLPYYLYLHLLAVDPQGTLVMLVINLTPLRDQLVTCPLGAGPNK